MSSPNSDYIIHLPTLLVCVGPRGCGKTIYCQQIMNAYFSNFPALDYKLYYANFEQERFRLMNNRILFYNDQRLINLDTIVRNNLINQIEQWMSFPTRAHIIILDGSFLDKDYIDKLVSLGKSYGYNHNILLFDYDNFWSHASAYKDHFQKSKANEYIPKIYLDNKISHSTDDIKADSEYIKKELLKYLTRTNGFNVMKIKSSDMILKNNHIKFIEDPVIKGCFLPSKSNYFVIGDCHENLDLLVKLLCKAEFVIKDGIIVDGPADIVFLGNLLDANDQTEKMINFIYDNLIIREKNVNYPKIYIVQGNNENFINSYKNNDQNAIKQKDLIDNFFKSINVLITKTSLRAKFEYIYQKTRNFYVITSKARDVYLTASICSTTDLSGFSLENLENQQKKHENNKIISQLMSQKEYTYYHIFGHVTFHEAIIHGNYIGLDTGCGDGGRLTGLLLKQTKGINHVWQLFYINGKINQDEILRKETVIKREITEKHVNKELLQKAKEYLKNGVGFISYTMAPAPAHKKDNILESLQEGIDYYRKFEGVSGLSLQPKFTGSRCQIYLNILDSAKSYAISKHGHLITSVCFTNIIADILKNISVLKDYSKNILKNNNDISMIILDGVLLPLLNKEMLDKNLGTIDKGLKSELDILKQIGFFEAMDIASHKEGFNLPKYYHKYSRKDQVRDADLYHKQVELNDKNTELCFTPFAFLKFCYDDGTEIVPDHFSPDIQFSYCMQLCDMDNKHIIYNFDENTAKINEFFEDLINQGFEGMVIKPISYNPNPRMAPCLKVRNSEYLRIIYGADYKVETKYNNLISNKNIGPKISASVNEFQLIQTLLRIPHSKILDQNEDAIEVVTKILELKETSNIIDPRL